MPSASSRLHLVDESRTVAAAAHVVFAGPLHLDRRLPAQRLGDGDRLDNDVGVGRSPPAKAAAGLHHVQRHLVRGYAGDLRGGGPIGVGHLAPAQTSSVPSAFIRATAFIGSSAACAR